VEVTSVLKPGTNELAVNVTNAWVNRLIGDQQPDATVASVPRATINTIFSSVSRPHLYGTIDER
jgi:hypothetical protein